LAYWLIPRAFALVFDDADIHSFGSVVKNVAFSQDRVALTYEWQADLPNKLRMVLLSRRGAKPFAYLSGAISDRDRFA